MWETFCCASAVRVKLGVGRLRCVRGRLAGHTAWVSERAGNRKTGILQTCSALQGRSFLCECKSKIQVHCMVQWVWGKRGTLVWAHRFQVTPGVLIWVVIKVASALRLMGRSPVNRVRICGRQRTFWWLWFSSMSAICEILRWLRMSMQGVIRQCQQGTVCWYQTEGGIIVELQCINP